MMLKRAIGQPRVNNLPPVWVAESDNKSSQRYLLPVCECPGHMHKLTVSDDDRSKLQFDADLNPAEEAYLELCEAAVDGRDPGDTSLSGTYPEVEELAKLMELARDELQVTMKPLRRPTSEAPLWVCADHYRDMVRDAKRWVNTLVTLACMRACERESAVQPFCLSLASCSHCRT